jgi:2-C-methyl-D-erythritol 4-phosphate cytidylyltransferase/2-C-methyl-D-erythritol 2,4-cyclodiphosphate synthase
MTTAAIIVASGEGQRFGSAIPKQYHKLKGQPIIAHTINAFVNLVSHIVVVINKNHEEFFRNTVGDQFTYVFGGARRQDSVYAGLKSLKEKNPQYVLIHDAVRPLVSQKIISDVILHLNKFQAVDVTLPLQDTIKQREPLKLLDRSNLYATQTPQGFHFSRLFDLYQQYNHIDYTDDISLAIEAGIKIGLVNGDKRNIKITTPDDLKYAEFLLGV